MITVVAGAAKGFRSGFCMPMNWKRPPMYTPTARRVRARPDSRVYRVDSIVERILFFFSYKEVFE